MRRSYAVIPASLRGQNRDVLNGVAYGVLVRFYRDHDAYNLVILPTTRIEPVREVSPGGVGRRKKISNQRFCDINSPYLPVITTAHSLPCLLHLWLNGVRGNASTSRPLIKASSRPLHRGGGQCLKIAPDSHARGEETGFHGGFGETDKSLPHPWHRIDRDSPPPLLNAVSQKPHDAAVTRGTPHEDGGSIFIQIPATPPESVHGLPMERFIKPVRLLD